MAYGRLQIRIDPKLQREVESIFNAQGIKTSTAITLFYKEVKRKRGFPFLPSPVPNKELAKALKEAEAGIGVKKYKTKKAFFDSLDKL